MKKPWDEISIKEDQEGSDSPSYGVVDTSGRAMAHGGSGLVPAVSAPSIGTTVCADGVHRWCMGRMEREHQRSLLVGCLSLRCTPHTHHSACRP